MIQGGQGLPLGAEAAQNLLVVEPRNNQFDGDSLAVLVISARCQIHGGHAARSYPSSNLVRSESAANHEVFSWCCYGRRHASPFLNTRGGNNVLFLSQ